MKLWIINQYARTPDKPGLTRHYDLARHLVKKGVETTIFNGSFDLYLGSSSLKSTAKADQNGIKKADFDGVRFVTIPTRPYTNNASIGRIRNMWRFSFDLFKELTSGNYEKPDIVIGSTMPLFAANAARRLAQRFNVPFVYEVRDLWPLTPIELGGHSKHHPFILYLDRLDGKLATQADLVVTTAPLMKQYYKERFGLPDEKFLWVTNGTDVEMFQQAAKLSGKEEKETFDIYYTGALGLANGLDEVFDVLPETAKAHPQVRLVIIGEGTMKDHLQNRARKENLPVHFHDAVPKPELPGLLAKADACLFYLKPASIYRYGISPNKLADYHAAGKPIIMIGECVRNPIQESEAGLVVPSSRDFPLALEKLLSMNQTDLIKFGEKGTEYAKQNYEWERLSKTLHERINSEYTQTQKVRLNSGRSAQ